MYNQYTRSVSKESRGWRGVLNKAGCEWKRTRRAEGAWLHRRTDPEDGDHVGVVIFMTRKDVGEGRVGVVYWRKLD